MPEKLDLIQTLREMTGIVALSGREQNMIRYMKAHMSAYCDDIYVDNMGNVIGTIRGQNNLAPSLMIFAHMDQLGLLVRRIETNGYLRLERLGGVPEKSLLAQRVVVEAEDGTLIPGVIGTKSHHVTPQDEKNKVPPYTQLYVDIGATSKAEVESLGVHVGAAVVYAPTFEVLNGRFISATSIDNRAGCFTLLRILEGLHENRPQGTVYVVATTQEEFNLRGALPAAQRLQPNLAICLDLVVAADTPDLQGHSDIALGAGPIISLYSFHGRGTLNGLLPHPGFAAYAIQVARESSITIQRGVTLGVLTDASYVQLVGDGIPTLDLAYPCRYTHSPIETIAPDDLEKLAQWVTQIAWSLNADFTLTRE
jgi:putative aminopeptidase